MDEVRLDPRQAPARAELLLAADFGQEVRGRPIHGGLESEDDGADEPGPRRKLGAVRTRRLAVSEGTDRPSGSAYDNPLRGTRGNAPVVPIGAPVIVSVGDNCKFPIRDNRKLHTLVVAGVGPAFQAVDVVNREGAGLGCTDGRRGCC